jgi:hypothetical protein
MPPRDINSLVRQSISSSLDEVFKATAEENTVAALVVLEDQNTGVFRFSGFSTGFKDLFPENNLIEVMQAGLRMEAQGLLSYAVTRFTTHGSEKWGYAMSMVSHRLFEATLDPSLPDKQRWEELPDDVTAGAQLINTARGLIDRNQSLREREHYLVIVPYSASDSFEGLVLLAYLEKELELSRLAEALEFLETKGLWLSAHQIMLASEAEHARTDGYRRLADMVLHEDNGFNQHVVNLLETLSKFKDDLSRVGVKEEELEYLAIRIESKQQLNKELLGPDPLTRVEPEFLYGCDTELPKDIPVSIQHAINVLGAAEVLKVGWELGEGAKQEPLIALEPTVIERIIRNSVKNSYQAGLQHSMARINVQIYADIIYREAQRFLELDIRDNAGGLPFDDFPRHITTATWLTYCSRRSELAGRTRGNGLLLISRYTDSSQGEFSIENIESADGKGVKYNISIRLRNGSD